MDSFIKDKSYKIKSNNKFSIIPDNVNFKVDIVEIKRINDEKDFDFVYTLF